MHASTSTPGLAIYKIVCGEGRRYVVYNAVEIGNPFTHVADKWYFQPYPVPLGLEPGDPFDSAEAAERAAWMWDRREYAEARIDKDRPD